jgi:aerobic-type carbon monoxide dehydrogenase small subunit (CoxS/CutS family)
MDTLVLNVNDQARVVEADPATPLAYVLRNNLDLKGTKVGCGLEQCGACAVLVDGKSTLTCVAPAGQFVNCSIVTIEATHDPVLERVKEAFVTAAAAQCGYCIPGIAIAVASLLESNPHPTEDESKRALQPHLCRCGTHVRILEAVRRLAANGSPT